MTIPDKAIEAFQDAFSKCQGLPVKFKNSAAIHQQAVIAGITAALLYLGKWPQEWVEGFIINAEQKGYRAGIEAAAKVAEQEWPSMGNRQIAAAIRALADEKVP